MDKRTSIIAVVLLIVGLGAFVVAVDNGVDERDDCVREMAETFARDLPGYFTPEQIVQHAETFCDINKDLEQQGQGRESAVDKLLNNR